MKLVSNRSPARYNRRLDAFHRNERKTVIDAETGNTIRVEHVTMWTEQRSKPRSCAITSI